MNSGAERRKNVCRSNSATNLSESRSDGLVTISPARSRSVECVRETRLGGCNYLAASHSGSTEITNYTIVSTQVLKALLENSSSVENSSRRQIESGPNPLNKKGKCRDHSEAEINFFSYTGNESDLSEASSPAKDTAKGRNPVLKSTGDKHCSDSEAISGFGAVRKTGTLKGTREQSASGSFKVYDGSGDGNAAYEDIIRLLQAIEDEDDDDDDHGGSGYGNLQKSSYDHGMEPEPHFGFGFESEPHAIDSDLKDVCSFLDEMEKKTERTFTKVSGALAATHTTTCGSNTTSRLEEMMSADPAELAHEILSLRVQLEDQRKGIQLLRATLSETKEKIASGNVEHETALNRANAHAEALIRRHQKFIKQLLTEKKSLNSTITKLVEDIKGQEEKFKRNIKALEDRHQVHVKRIREAQGMADKIKREKWMEVKTQKIKEMTVKGLEPELSRMAAVQQKELADLKNAHRAELEAVESRMTRRASQLMDDLRAELLKERADAIERATADLRCRMERDFDDERNRFEAVGQRLKEELRRQEEKADRRESEFRQRLADAKKEADEERERVTRELFDKLEEARRQKDIQVSCLRAAAEREKENWANEYRRKESVRISELETELQQRFKRDRDRDIEAIIEALEKESAELQLKMTEESENKLKRLHEKLEKEVREAEANEAVFREKLSDLKCQMTDKEETISRLGLRVRELEMEAGTLKERCDRMTSERNNLKEVIRQEFRDDLSEIENKKRLSEKEISRLKETHMKQLAHKDHINIIEKNRMQKELAKVYDRMKLIAGKKEAAMEALKKENEETRQRCRHLESLLDRQRINLLMQ